MPPLPDANKVLRAAFVQVLDAHEIVNIFHAAYAGAGNSQADLDSIAIDWASAIATFLNPLQEVDLLNNRIDVVDLTSRTALTSTQPVPGTGSHSGGLIGGNTACCVSWHIARRYRGGHPRTYIGGIPVSALNSEREFTAAYASAAQTAAAGYLNDVPLIVAGAYTLLTPINLSYFSGGAMRVTPVQDVITAATVNTRIDSQRRRTGKS